MAMATINLTPVIVVFVHVIIVLMLEMIVDNRILEQRHIVRLLVHSARGDVESK